MTALIIAAAKVIDAQGSLEYCLTLENKLKALGHKPIELTIDPLSVDWHSPLATHHFRSGAGPIEALEHAVTLLQQGHPAVVISGKDNLRTGYHRNERQQLMDVYGEHYPITQAYTQLSDKFIQHHHLDAQAFEHYAQALFRNYFTTYQHLNPNAAPPDERWFKKITKLFRGVDCANPNMDFNGRVLITNPSIAEQLNISPQQRVQVAGVCVETLPLDGKAGIDSIVSYQHLARTFQAACQQAYQQTGCEFKQLFSTHQALLDVYTCFPVVPLAFLHSCGFITDFTVLEDFLNKHPITLSGGMNLAKGPWNNPTLNSLIDMYQQLQQNTVNLGGIHGNGGLGYKQGFAILASSSHH